MLHLREWKKEELYILPRWFADEEAFLLWSVGAYAWPFTEEEQNRHYTRFSEDESAGIFAAVNESGELVGHLTMRNADYEKKSIHFGYIVIAPEQKGRGIGKAMVSEALSYAKHVLGMDKVTIGVFEHNFTAIRCYESVGFKIEETQERIFGDSGPDWAMHKMAIKLSES